MSFLVQDTFDYISWDEMQAAGWRLRQATFGAPGGGRTMSRSDSRMVDLSSTGVILKVRPDPDNPGKHLVGHISLGVLPFVYGTIRTRVNFGRPKGAHGAVWHQSGYGENEAELDLVEFFGERKPGSNAIESQAVQHTVHVGPLTADGKTNQFPRYTWTDGDPLIDDVPSFQGRGQFGENRTWWYTSHVYQVVWDSTGYTFSVDGVSVGKTVIPSDLYSSPSASSQGELILSLLSNDDEYDTLTSYIANGGKYSDFDMTVTRLEVIVP